MKALIRTHEDGTTEVMTEPFSPWVENNLAFLTGTETDSEGNPMKGDGWVLVTDYEPADGEAVEGRGYDSTRVPELTVPVEIEDEPADEDVCTRIAEVPEETVTIGDRTYTLSELKTLLH